MTALQQAEQVYRTERCDRSLIQDLALHNRTGYTLVTATCIAAARPVRKDAREADVLNPSVVFPEGRDAWLVWIVAGDIREAIAALPYELPWIGWQKKNRLRWHRLADFRLHSPL